MTIFFLKTSQKASSDCVLNTKLDLTVIGIKTYKHDEGFTSLKEYISLYISLKEFEYFDAKNVRKKREILLVFAFTLVFKRTIL